MERLEGETLADRLVRGPLPFGEALACAGQVADALDRAHGQGIVHRDLKPANIMLTRSGVKLLDFGLARLLEAEAPALGSQTRTALTQEGTIVGTLQYMAPEQLEGKPTDARTDLFAFGAILYEMVTGRRAFDSPSQAGIVGAILHAEVPAVASAPPAFARVLCRVSGQEARGPLVLRARRAVAAQRDRRRGAQRRRDDARRRSDAVAIARLDRGGDGAGGAGRCVVARDGCRQPAARRSTCSRSCRPRARPSRAARRRRSRRTDATIAFVATDCAGRTLLYLRSRSVDGRAAAAGTDDATLPFWAPDGRRLGFFARGALKTVAGRRRDAADAGWRAGASGRHLEQRRRDRVRAVSERPGSADPGRRRHGHAGDGGRSARRTCDGSPRFFPMAGTTCISPSTIKPPGHGRFASPRSIPPRRASSCRPGQRHVQPLPGSCCFVATPRWWRSAFDAGALQLTGTPVIVADSVSYSPLGYQMFASASTGALVYQEPEPGWHLTWFDRSRPAPGAVVPAAGQYNGLCLSHDGSRLVYDLVDAERRLDQPGHLVARRGHAASRRG